MSLTLCIKILGKFEGILGGVQVKYKGSIKIAFSTNISLMSKTVHDMAIVTLTMEDVCDLSNGVFPMIFNDP